MGCIFRHGSVLRGREIVGGELCPQRHSQVDHITVDEAALSIV